MRIAGGSTAPGWSLGAPAQETPAVTCDPHAAAEPTAARNYLHRMRRGLRISGLLCLGSGALAYLLLPGWWHLHGHPSTAKDFPTITHTKSGIPGDPINVALIGTEEDVVQAMNAAGWLSADKTTWRT